MSTPHVLPTPAELKSVERQVEQAAGAVERTVIRLRAFLAEHGDDCPPELEPTLSDLGALWCVRESARERVAFLTGQLDELETLLPELDYVRRLAPVERAAFDRDLAGLLTRNDPPAP